MNGSISALHTHTVPFQTTPDWSVPSGSIICTSRHIANKGHEQNIECLKGVGNPVFSLHCNYGTITPHLEINRPSIVFFRKVFFQLFPDISSFVPGKQSNPDIIWLVPHVVNAQRKQLLIYTSTRFLMETIRRHILQHGTFDFESLYMWLRQISTSMRLFSGYGLMIRISYSDNAFWTAGGQQCCHGTKGGSWGYMS